DEGRLGRDSSNQPPTLPCWGKRTSAMSVCMPRRTPARPADMQGGLAIPKVGILVAERAERGLGLPRHVRVGAPPAGPRSVQVRAEPAHRGCLPRKAKPAFWACVAALGCVGHAASPARYTASRYRTSTVEYVPLARETPVSRSSTSVRPVG